MKLKEGPNLEHKLEKEQSFCSTNLRLVLVDTSAVELNFLEGGLS